MGRPISSWLAGGDQRQSVALFVICTPHAQGLRGELQRAGHIHVVDRDVMIGACVQFSLA